MLNLLLKDKYIVLAATLSSIVKRIEVSLSEKIMNLCNIFHVN